MFILQNNNQCSLLWTSAISSHVNSPPISGNKKQRPVWNAGGSWLPWHTKYRMIWRSCHDTARKFSTNPSLESFRMMQLWKGDSGEKFFTTKIWNSKRRRGRGARVCLMYLHYVDMAVSYHFDHSCTGRDMRIHGNRNVKKCRALTQIRSYCRVLVLRCCQMWPNTKNEASWYDKLSSISLHVEACDFRVCEICY